MKICIDDGSTNIKLAWTENGERRNAISPNSFKSEWSAPFRRMKLKKRSPYFRRQARTHISSARSRTEQKA